MNIEQYTFAYFSAYKATIQPTYTLSYKWLWLIPLC